MTPENGATADGTAIALTTGACLDGGSRFLLLPTGSLQHTNTGKCLMPADGSTNPPDGTNLVLSSTCGAASQAFTHQGVGGIAGGIRQDSSGKCLHSFTLPLLGGDEVTIQSGACTLDLWTFVTRKPVLCLSRTRS